MLTQESKNALENLVELIKEHGFLELAQHRGPAKLLTEVLFTSDVEPQIDENISKNRSEAEQYLGGLLGCC